MTASLQPAPQPGTVLAVTHQTCGHIIATANTNPGDLQATFDTLASGWEIAAVPLSEVRARYGRWCDTCRTGRRGTP